MAEDLAQTLLVTSRKHLTLALRTLVMRDLFRHRTSLIKHYLRQHGIMQDWNAFMADGDLSHARAIRERLAHDKACRRLAQAKAEFDGILTKKVYADCTAPLLSRDLHQTALRLVTHRLTLIEDQLEDAAHEYARERWAAQQDYYREFQATLQAKVYDGWVSEGRPAPLLDYSEGIPPRRTPADSDHGTSRLSRASAQHGGADTRVPGGQARGA
jgi:hypothetical protein